MNLQILRPLLSGPDFVLFPPSFPDDFRRRLSRRSAKDDGGKEDGDSQRISEGEEGVGFPGSARVPPRPLSTFVLPSE